jgi:peptide/nickel transport system permease protein
MLLNVMFVALPLWGRGLRLLVRGSRPLRNRQRVMLAVFFGVPLLGGLIWALTVPRRVDRTLYKQAAAIDASPGSSAPMEYESIIWPPVPYGLDEDDLDAKHLPPVWWESERERSAISSAEGDPHWLGTDGIGRDTLCRMIWGGRVSLAVGIVAVSIYATIGIIVGSIAGYFRGITDLVISRIIEVVICFPSFFLILTIVAFIGPSIFNIMVVIGLIGWTRIARLVRGEFLRLGEQDFVHAGRALGYSAPRIIFRHVLPNSLAPVLVAATFGIAGAILTESALSFLGFGITVPTPSWGGILKDGRDAIFRAPWLIYFPGIAIFITITCYNLVGEAFRDAADPRLRDGKA